MAQFSKKAIGKIRDTVVTVERWVKNEKGARRRPVGPSKGQWVMIGEGDEDGKYSWTGIKYNEEGEFEQDEEYGSGDHTEEKGYAVEARWKSAYVLEGSIVWMVPCVGQDYYIFDYAPGAELVTSPANINFPARNGAQKPGEGTLAFLEYNEEGELQAGQFKKVFNAYKSVVQLNDTKVAPVVFGLGGKWYIVGADC